MRLPVRPICCGSGIDMLRHQFVADRKKPASPVLHVLTRLDRRYTATPNVERGAFLTPTRTND